MSTYAPDIHDVHEQIRIEGLSCPGDAVALERRLAVLPGISGVVVNPVTEVAYVTFDDRRISSQSIRHAIRASGFRSD